MAVGRSMMLYGMLLCISLTFLARIQGRSIPTSRATGAYTFTNQISYGDSRTNASISIMGWSATAPSPATWLSPSMAPMANSSRRTMRRLAGSTTPANVTQPHASAQKKTCIPPPKCEWSFDKDGVARPECTTPPHTACVWGAFCPDLIPTIYDVGISLLLLGLMIAFSVWLVWAWADDMIPGKNKWTRMCFIAIALGLIFGLRCTVSVNERIQSGSPPRLDEMCLPPPECSWTYDNAGGMEPDCTQRLPDGTQRAVPLLRPRIFGVMCPHQVPLYVMPYVTAASLDVIGAYFGFGLMTVVHLLACAVQPCCKQIHIPWTRSCCYAYSIGLVIGLILKTSVSITITAA